MEDLTTQDILDMLDGTTSNPYSVNDLIAELKTRIVDDEYEDEEMRGGIRPRKPNL